MFLDKVQISIKAGSGGNGHTSFLRDRQTMHGGADGGDGGKGGNVVFVGSTRVDNLIEFRYTKKFVATDGGNGEPRNRHGKDGTDCVIPVPLGTRIYKIHAEEAEKEPELLADITKEGQEYLALHGGSGGRGNWHFMTSRRQTPNFSHDGVKTTEYNVLLELESIADVGLVGFPNAGKSTFLSIVTRANPKIASYPFTTLYPNIGVLNYSGGNLILADIPGLIEGASEGKGLGLDFLKHINRTRLLVHMIDVAETDGRKADEDYRVINNELAKYSADLTKKPQIVVLNKIDAANPERLKEIEKVLKTEAGKVYKISCATREGVDELVKQIIFSVSKLPKTQASETFAELEDHIDKNAFNVSCDEEGIFHVTGPMIDNLIRGVVLSDTESASYFHRRLQKSGVIKELRNIGLENGATVEIAGTTFEWQD